MDRITYSPSGNIWDLVPHANTHLQTMEFPDLPLLDFFGLLKLVLNMAPEYEFFSRQCLWFCWVLKRTCMDLWESKITPEGLVFTGMVANVRCAMGLETETEVVNNIKKLYAELLPSPHVLVDMAEHNVQRWQHQAETWQQQAEAAEAERHAMEAKYDQLLTETRRGGRY
ncbi:hypothetical protein K439DRAFT_1621947 [Ramaria rubella]|nr:hypothetical protein K439DRAFT_1621947 [Ramaria rubella]